MTGQPDIIIMNNHKEYNGLCIEFKSLTNNYKISEGQLKMREDTIKMGIDLWFLMTMIKLLPILTNICGESEFRADTVQTNLSPKILTKSISKNFIKKQFIYILG